MIGAAILLPPWFNPQVRCRLRRRLVGVMSISGRVPVYGFQQVLVGVDPVSAQPHPAGADQPSTRKTSAGILPYNLMQTPACCGDVLEYAGMRLVLVGSHCKVNAPYILPLRASWRQSDCDANLVPFQLARWATRCRQLAALGPEAVQHILSFLCMLAKAILADSTTRYKPMRVIWERRGNADHFNYV